MHVTKQVGDPAGVVAIGASVAGVEALPTAAARAGVLDYQVTAASVGNVLREPTPRGSSR